MGVKVAPPIDLTPLQREIITKLLQKHIPNTEVWAHGSRVNGTARPPSDLDLVVFARPEQRENIFELKNEFEESDLPFRIDLFIWDEVPTQFHHNIEQDHIILQNSP